MKHPLHSNLPINILLVNEYIASLLPPAFSFPHTPHDLRYAFTSPSHPLLPFVGTSEYDRRADKKVRIPAWCDRILWKVKGGERSARTGKAVKTPSMVRVTPLWYNRAELQSSDHKPVLGLFHCRLKRIIAERQSAVVQELLKKLDQYNNASIPRLAVTGNDIEFGKVHYGVRISPAEGWGGGQCVTSPWSNRTSLEPDWAVCWICPKLYWIWWERPFVLSTSPPPILDRAVACLISKPCMYTHVSVSLTRLRPEVVMVALVVCFVHDTI